MQPARTPTADASLVDKAVSLWKQGELVVIPTETVYGLAADAANARAVAHIYEVKLRPRFNPLIVHVTGKDMAKRYVEWSALADTLSDAFWPGPFTLVLKRKKNSPIADLVSAGGDTIAIRMPAHPLAQQLLAAFGGGLAAPSANRSGKVSPTTAAHVKSEFGDAVPLIVDGGTCTVGLESTVVDVSGGRAVLLRKGSITRAMLERIVPIGEATAGGTIKSPGMLEKHYAPALPLRLNATSVNKGEALIAFGPKVPEGAGHVFNLSESENLAEAAANLFAALREFDNPRYTGIAVMPVPNQGIGEAINDRLERAALR